MAGTPNPLDALLFSEAATPASPATPATKQGPVRTMPPAAWGPNAMPATTPPPAAAPSLGGFGNVPKTLPGVPQQPRTSTGMTPAVAAPVGASISSPRLPPVKSSSGAGFSGASSDARAAMMVKGRDVLDALLSVAVGHGASDIHLLPHSPARYRIKGALVPIQGDALTADATLSMAMHLLSTQPERRMAEGDIQDVEMGYTHPTGGRFRISLLRQRGTLGMVARCIRNEPPSLDQLTAPPRLRDLVGVESGLVLLMGRAGSGKSTTLASLLDGINAHRQANIVTLETPVEFVLRPRQASIIQRDVGLDTRSVAAGVQAALRQDADVVALGTLPDAAAVEAAISAAESGRLVVGVVTSSGIGQGLQHLLSHFPVAERAAALERLLGSLRTVVFQRMVPCLQSPGRMAAFEVLEMTSQTVTVLQGQQGLKEVPRLIRDGEGSNTGSLTMASGLGALVRARMVDPAVAQALMGPGSVVEGNGD